MPGGHDEIMRRCHKLVRREITSATKAQKVFDPDHNQPLYQF